MLLACSEHALSLLDFSLQVMLGHMNWMRLCISKSWWRAARRLLTGAHQQLPKGSLEALGYEVRLRSNDVKQRADELMAFADEVFRDQKHGLDEVPGLKNGCLSMAFRCTVPCNGRRTPPRSSWG